MIEEAVRHSDRALTIESILAVYWLCIGGVLTVY